MSDTASFVWIIVFIQTHKSADPDLVTTSQSCFGDIFKEKINRCMDLFFGVGLNDFTSHLIFKGKYYSICQQWPFEQQCVFPYQQKRDNSCLPRAQFPSHSLVTISSLNPEVLDRNESFYC